MSHCMNKKVISIGFMLLLFSVSIINLIIPQRSFSESENRYLQKLPEPDLQDIASGKFTQDFADYTSDQFIARDGWISLKTIAELALLKKDNGRVYFGKQDTLFDAAETTDDKLLSYNAETLSEYIKELKESLPGLNASVLLIPTSTAVLSDLLPAYAPVPDQQTAIAKAYKTLKNEAIVFDPTDLLKANKSKYLYFRTDHHWTSAAAHLVYTEWAKLVGLAPVPLSETESELLSSSFYGSLYSKANLFSIKPDRVVAYRFTDAVPVSVNYDKNTTSNTLYFEEFLAKKDKYLYFLGEHKPVIEVKTGEKNGKTILVIKDSYAHCFIPFLTAHYEKILVVDPRYFNADYKKYAVENNVSDVLFLYNLPNFATDKSISRLSG